MTLHIDQKLFTREDYHRMVKAGVLAEDEKVELISGNIITMSPIGIKHLATVNRFTWIFKKMLSDDYILSIQNPVCINDYSEPEPDIAVLNYKKNFYDNKKPTPTDIPLIIEVSDTTLEKDQELKMPLYAKAGIAESWVVDLNNSKIFVFTDPSLKGYLTKRLYFPGDQIEVSSIPDLTIPVTDIFGL